MVIEYNSTYLLVKFPQSPENGKGDKNYIPNQGMKFFHWLKQGKKGKKKSFPLFVFVNYIIIIHSGANV